MPSKVEVKNIQQLTEIIEDPASNRKFFHLYCIYRGLFKTTTYEYWLLSDPSCPNGIRVSMKGDLNSYPKAQIGDIVRIHRVGVDTKINYLECLHPRNVLLWKEFSKEPERVSSARKYTYVDEIDGAKLKELEIEFYYQIPRIKDHLLNLPSRAGFIDIAGKMIEKFDDYDSFGNVLVRIIDGTSVPSKSLTNFYFAPPELTIGNKRLKNEVRNNSMLVLIYSKQSPEETSVHHDKIKNLKINDNIFLSRAVLNIKSDKYRFFLSASPKDERSVRLIEPGSTLGTMIDESCEKFGDIYEVIPEGERSPTAASDSFSSFDVDTSRNVTFTAPQIDTAEQRPTTNNNLPVISQKSSISTSSTPVRKSPMRTRSSPAQPSQLAQPIQPHFLPATPLNPPNLTHIASSTSRIQPTISYIPPANRPFNAITRLSDIKPADCFSYNFRNIVGRVVACNIATDYFNFYILMEDGSQIDYKSNYFDQIITDGSINERNTAAICIYNNRYPEETDAHITLAKTLKPGDYVQITNVKCFWFDNKIKIELQANLKSGKSISKLDPQSAIVQSLNLASIDEQPDYEECMYEPTQFEPFEDENNF